MRLEAVRDFETFAQFLHSPKDLVVSVRSFGFCIYCDDITEYSWSGGPDEPYNITCCKCHRTFEGRFYLTGSRIPAQLKAKADELNSREKQKEYFLERLEAAIAGKKKARRILNTEVRKLAALRS